MVVDELLRIVKLRNGRLTPAEFRLRPGERGLSLFAHVLHPTPDDVVSAVRAAGKQGDLAAAIIEAKHIRGLRLMLVKSAGGTADKEINAIHYEARLTWARQLLLWIRGISTSEYFNEQLSPKLCSLARLLS